MLPILLATLAVLPQVPRSESDLVSTAQRVWMCPLHPETHEDGPGSCEVCRRPYEQKTVAYRWACPMHTHVGVPVGGVCPVCGMDPVVTTVELFWRCETHPGESALEPGKCPKDGKDLSPASRVLAHGDHNPRHGGIFFMAPDRHHHLEGTLSQQSLFRLYLYDNYTEPLPPGAARARVGDRALAPGSAGGFLELRVADLGQPAEIVAYVDFGDGEERFDFIFTTESVPLQLPVLEIPRAPAEMLAAIVERDTRIRALMGLGAWTQLYVPALQAKQLAMAFDAATRGERALHVKRLVRGAWLLDVNGDLGSRPGVEEAYALFAEGVMGLRSAGAR